MYGHQVCTQTQLQYHTQRTFVSKLLAHSPRLDYNNADTNSAHQGPRIVRKQVYIEMTSKEQGQQSCLRDSGTG